MPRAEVHATHVCCDVHGEGSPLVSVSPPEAEGAAKRGPKGYLFLESAFLVLVEWLE